MTNERKIEYLTKMLGILNESYIICRNNHHVWTLECNTHDIIVPVQGLCQLHHVMVYLNEASKLESLIMMNYLEDRKPKGVSAYWFEAPSNRDKSKVIKGKEDRMIFLNELIRNLQK